MNGLPFHLLSQPCRCPECGHCAYRFVKVEFVRYTDIGDPVYTALFECDQCGDVCGIAPEDVSAFLEDFVCAEQDRYPVNGQD